jgi:tyrosine-protein phosphatase non-receptor type 14/21
VAHSLQEVSEPLTAARHAQLQKRNSIEIAGITHGFEGLRLKERTMSASAADVAPRSLLAGSQPSVFSDRTKQEDPEEQESESYGHKKSLSDATMLIHSSEEDEDFEEDNGSQALPARPEPQRPATYSQEPQLTYPCASVTAVTGPLHILEPKSHVTETEKRARDINPVHLVVEAQRSRRDGLLTPSMSESDLTTSGRYRARRDSLKKRPVSDLLSGKKNIVEGLPPLGVSHPGAEMPQTRRVAPSPVSSASSVLSPLFFHVLLLMFLSFFLVLFPFSSLCVTLLLCF